MAEQRKIVLASRNQDKIRELSELCEGLPFAVSSSLDYPDLPEVIEDGTTLLGNACRKAIVTAAYTGEIAVSDDTALQIDALNGLPDIFAARFSGPDATYGSNAELVLDLMEKVPDGLRQARFVTVSVWVDPRPGESLAELKQRAKAAAGGVGAVSPVTQLPDLDLPPTARTRWLHNPFARPIHLQYPEEEADFWNGLGDRRRLWDQYRYHQASVVKSLGPDRARLDAIYHRLLEPYLSGERPTDAPADHMQLPDSRIWTAAVPGQSDGGTILPPPTVVCPSGLPSDAPGFGTNTPLWLEMACEGRVLGEITWQPRGRGGFGYDPVFRVLGADRTLAEFSPDEKNAVSHRGQALRRLVRAARAGYGLAE